MSSSRPTSIRTRFEPAAVVLAACISLSGCASAPATAPARATTLADLILMPTIARRGDNFADREQIAALDRKGDWAGLLHFALERQKRAPDEPDWLVIAGYAWLRQGEYENAIASLSRVTRVSPEDVDAWILFGETQRLAKQPGPATQTLERASAIGRTSFALFFVLGEAYRDSGRLDRAIDAYREAVRIEPDFAPAWYELGVAQLRLNDPQAARVVSGQLERLDPELARDLANKIRGR